MIFVSKTVEYFSMQIFQKVLRCLHLSITQKIHCPKSEKNLFCISLVGLFKQARKSKKCAL